MTPYTDSACPRAIRRDEQPTQTPATLHSDNLFAVYLRPANVREHAARPAYFR